MCSLETIIRNSAAFISAGSYYERLKSDTFIVYDNYEWHEYRLAEAARKPDEVLVFKLNLDKCVGLGSHVPDVLRVMNYLYNKYKCPAVCFCPPSSVFGLTPCIAA